MTTHPDLTTAAAYMDEAMKAIALAKQALLGGAGGALFVSSGPDLAAAEASPGNPYGSSTGLPGTGNRTAFRVEGSSKHGRYDAGSAAEVAEGVDWGAPCQQPEAHGFGMTEADWLAGQPMCGVAAHHVDTTCTQTRPGNGTYRCTRESGHEGSHRDITGEWWLVASQIAADLCPAQWGEPPETMLCSLASGHDGNHATAEGVEWGGRWETAEPGAKDSTVTRGVEPGLCMATTPTRYGDGRVTCTLANGHDGDHVAGGTGDPGISWPEGGSADWEAHLASHLALPGAEPGAKDGAR